MTYRPLIPPPNRAEGTRFPAVVAALALVLLVLAWRVPRPLDLREPATLRPFRLPLVVVPLRPTAPPPVGPSIFDAARGGAAPGAGAATVPPVGGAGAAGVAMRGGRPTAFLLLPDGRVVALPLGGALAGWRLMRIGVAGLDFRRGAEVATLPFAGDASAPPGAGR